MKVLRITKIGPFGRQRVYFEKEANAVNAFVNLKPEVPKHPDYSAFYERLIGGQWSAFGVIHQGKLDWKQL